jgi:hypothetical protein
LVRDILGLGDVPMKSSGHRCCRNPSVYSRPTFERTRRNHMRVLRDRIEPVTAAYAAPQLRRCPADRRSSGFFVQVIEEWWCGQSSARWSLVLCPPITGKNTGKIAKTGSRARLKMRLEQQWQALDAHSSRKNNREKKGPYQGNLCHVTGKFGTQANRRRGTSGWAQDGVGSGARKCDPISKV